MILTHSPFDGAAKRAGMLMKWRHSGFNVFCGHRIQPGQEEAMENLARYITRGASACAARPRLFFAREDDLHS